MKTVITHSGKFHPDDVFAVATIMLLEGKENINVVRTREQEIINTGDWVVDVGFEYDPERLRFDHHQPDAPVRENSIGYAAFGLVWRHYGEAVCGSSEIAEKIEQTLVLPIDAHDVGISLIELNEYDVRPAELFDVIYSFVPPWQSDLNVDEQFLKAVDLAYDYLLRLINKGKAKQNMKAYAAELYESAEDKSVIESSIGLSASAFMEYEGVKAVMSPDNNGSGNWVISTVPIESKMFEHVAYFPESWRGLSGAALEEESGITGSQFCHKGGFFFVGTKAAAIEAATHLEDSN